MKYEAKGANQLKRMTFITGFLLGSIIFGAAGVYAGGNIEAIKAYLNHEITFEVNKMPWQPSDGLGKPLAAITYKATTYLPLRVFAEEFGYRIDYNEQAKKAYLYSNSFIQMYSENFIISSFQSENSIEEMNKLLGQPIKTETFNFPSGDEALNVTYKNGNSVDYLENWAVRIHIKSKNIKTARDIQVGSKLEDVKRLYGTIFTPSDDDGTQLYYGLNEGLYFFFEKEKVVEFGTWAEFD